ncbi:MAG: DUF5696 domain-containing protein [Ruminococcus sp.]
MKRIISALCAVVSAVNLSSFPASAEEHENAMRLSAENDRLELYIDDTSGNAELRDKKTGALWRSCPLNAADDPAASGSVKSELCSSLEIVYGEPDKRTDTKQCSEGSAEIDVKDIKNGAEITYYFKKAGITVPLRLVLGENYLEASVDISEIEEKKESRILTEIGIMNSFGAASSEEEGYFVIPDGSGALINFNNGKTNAKSFSGMVYGRDLTAAPLTEPSDISQIYLPMYGIVNGENALLAVITDGDANAKLSASVSGMSKSSYNLCSFDFILRSKDSYYMSGDNSNAITVFEEGEIKTPEISVRYYPLEDSGENGMSYSDIAAAYRSYLINEMNVSPSEDISPGLCVTLYGGTEKERSFLGFPIKMKTAVTTCEQAERIMETLRAAGVSHMTVNYSKWTDAGIKNKIDTEAEPAGVIGKDEFAQLLKYGEENNIAIYPGVSDTVFRSGEGYSERRDSAVRVSGEYARHYFYDTVSGEIDGEKRSLSLLSPEKYDVIFESLSENYSAKGIKNICLEKLTGSLCSDCGRRGISRDMAQDILTEGYKTLASSGCSIMADTANAYAIPLADIICNVPLSSGRYDIFDEDIPFYQMVLCGIKPLASEPVNGSDDSDEFILKAVAAGMYPHYNMTGEKADVLRGTELEWLYYAYYDSWTEQAAQDNRFVNDVLSGVRGQLITEYRQVGSRIYTHYENGSEIVTDLEKCSVTSDGKEYFLSDYRVSGG